MVIFRGNIFKKKDFLPFSTNIYFREKRFKRAFVQRKTHLWEKDLEAFFSFNKGFRCFRKVYKVMKSYKIFLILLQRKF